MRERTPTSVVKQLMTCEDCTVLRGEQGSQVGVLLGGFFKLEELSISRSFELQNAHAEPLAGDLDETGDL